MSKLERPLLAVVTSNPQHRQKILRRRLPKPIITVQQRSKLRLHELLSSCFAISDDHFFDLAKNALQQEDQDGYFCAMRELRSKKSKIFETFFDGLEHRFLALADVDDLHLSSDAFAAASIDQLAIVGNDDLDQLVAKEAMISRCLSQCKGTIEQLARRFDAVVPVDVGTEQLPVSPNHLCELFIRACKTLDVNNRSLLVLFKIFERTVLQQLNALYVEMNAHLEERGILPNKVTSPIKVAHVHQEPAGSHCSNGVNSPVEPEFLHLDAEMLVQPLQPLTASARAAPGENTQKSTTRKAAARQSALASQGSTVIHSNSGDRHEDMVAHVLTVLANRQHIAPSFIPLLQQLHTPIARIARADSTFFSDNDHAARRLVNVLSTAALAFDKTANADIETDPLFAKIKAVIAKLQNDAYRDPQVIQALLKNFEQFVRQEQRRADLYEKRMLDAEQGKHKAQTARKQVLEAIAEITQGMDVRSGVRQIINKAWHQVMFVTALKHGIESPEWDRASQTLIDLVVHTQPCVSHAERARSLQSLQDLKAQVRAGLESLFFDAFEIDSVVERLDKIINQLAKEEPVPSRQKGPPPTPPATASTELTSAPTVDAAFMAQARNLGRGSWFDLATDVGPTRCRLAAIIGDYEKYIFVQRTGNKIAEKTLEEVARALAIQELVALDSNRIFDQALEHVIAGMRN